jgi:hypothetical protein
MVTGPSGHGGRAPCFHNTTNHVSETGIFLGGSSVNKSFAGGTVVDQEGNVQAGPTQGKAVGISPVAGMCDAFGVAARRGRGSSCMSPISCMVAWIASHACSEDSMCFRRLQTHSHAPSDCLRYTECFRPFTV